MGGDTSAKAPTLSRLDAEAAELCESPGHTPRHAVVIERATIARGERVLEVGCGAGALTEALLRAVAQPFRLVAIDCNAALARRADARLRGDPRLSVQVADGRRLPFESDAFD